MKNKIIFLCFFFSGFCGLLYQLIWLRMAYSHFGVITPNLSIVLSVFMAGIGAGSWGVSRCLPALTQKTRSTPLQLYALGETFIGLGAFLVPVLFRKSEQILLSVGEMNSAVFLIYSGLLIIVSLLPWCIAMGATIPLMLAHLKLDSSLGERNFSFLYIANIAGAIAGTVLTSFVLIELLGISATGCLAGSLNFLIALLALYAVPKASSDFDRASSAALDVTQPSLWVSTLLFTTGFVSLGQEVVLSRMLTPVFGTSIYAFAAILGGYLIATAAGTAVYRRWFLSDHVSSSVVVILPAVSLLMVILNESRLGASGWNSILSFTPFFFLLGILTPQLVDGASHGDARIAGRLYGINLLGCILGPLAAGYLLLPHVSGKIALVMLSVLLIPFAITFSASMASRWRKTSFALTGILLVGSIFIRTYEDGPLWSGKTEIRRDYTATVISFGEGFRRALLVNGMGLTILTDITKVMAHLPASCLQRPPRSSLVICFGMGTTYRSLLTWGMDVTAVELVPSVKDAFGFYHGDAADVLKNPHGQIVVDDGRRFLQRTETKFDLITVDPPPPVEAAGSGLLYSTDFYELAKRRLADGGILQQWLPEAEPHIVIAVAHSLARSFPYIRVFRGCEGWGTHFLASNTPIALPSLENWKKKLPAHAKDDLLEWHSSGKLDQAYALIFKQEIPFNASLFTERIPLVSDDRPFNEYYFLRRLISKKPKYFL